MIGIKNFKMPNNCLFCRLYVGSDSKYCAITKTWNACSGIKRAYDCPLVEESKTGHWIDTGSGQQCSECGEIQHGYDNYRMYCAYCGARMESEGEDADSN